MGLVCLDLRSREISTNNILSPETHDPYAQLKTEHYLTYNQNYSFTFFFRDLSRYPSVSFLKPAKSSYFFEGVYSYLTQCLPMVCR